MMRASEGWSIWALVQSIAEARIDGGDRGGLRSPPLTGSSVILAFALLLGPTLRLGDASAYSRGITGYSTSGCTSCHDTS